MICYFKRNEINISKYDACIETSINSRIYAYSWYLDIVADNWDALVLNDYEAVMPLPWRQKYLIKYVYPPVWTQQLGIFSSLKMNAQLTKEFINSIPKKFKKITIQFNSENDLSLFKVKERVNYILPLNKTYEEIYKNYRKDRKDRLRQVENKKLLVKKCTIVELIEVGKKYYSFLNINHINYLKLKKLSDSLTQMDFVELIGVYSEDNKFLGGSFFLKEKNRISYLFSVATQIGKNEQIITYVINEVVRENSNTNLVLDFEGSMIKGIADFYKGFGASEEYYFKFLKVF